jgi:hypothetical protein
LREVEGEKQSRSWNELITKTDPKEKRRGKDAWNGRTNTVRRITKQEPDLSATD